MGKRQIRIFSDQIPEKITSLLDVEINMILKNDVTLHGKILESQAKQILFRDSIRRKHRIKLEEIAEIIVDQPSQY